MVWVLIVLALGAAAVVLLDPLRASPPRWRTALAARLEHLAHRLRRGAPPVHDPFETLWVQERLTAVADHVRRLELDPRTFARAERIIASQLAYDQLLAQACHQAGVDVPTHAPGDPAERFREEVELAERGWAW